MMKKAGLNKHQLSLSKLHSKVLKELKIEILCLNELEFNQIRWLIKAQERLVTIKSSIHQYRKVYSKCIKTLITGIIRVWF